MTTDPQSGTEAILQFWFEELTARQHFAKDAALDAAIRTRFGITLEAAARCELFAWRATAPGRLAEILVLDQFSRNVYRDTPRAFAHDAMALVLAQELVAGGHDRALPPAQAPRGHGGQRGTGAVAHGDQAPQRPPQPRRAGLAGVQQRGDGVVHRARVRALGGQAVVHRQHGRVGARCQRGGERVVVGHRAQHPAAAVEIHDQVAVGVVGHVQARGQRRALGRGQGDVQICNF